MQKTLLFISALLLAFYLSGCSRMTAEEFVKTVEQDETFCKTISTPDLEIKIRCLPKGYFRAKNVVLLHQGTLDSAAMADRDRAFTPSDSMYYFNIEIVRSRNDSAKGDPVYSMPDEYAFSASLQQLLFGLREQVFLIDDTDTKVRSMNDLFERNFGLIPQKRMFLVFPKVARDDGRIRMFIDALGSYHVGSTVEWKKKKIEKMSFRGEING